MTYWTVLELVYLEHTIFRLRPSSLFMLRKAENCSLIVFRAGQSSVNGTEVFEN